MNLLPPTESKRLKLSAEVALCCLDLELDGMDLNPQSTPSPLLPALAWELGLEIQGLNEKEHRALLASALEIRYQEGSVHATTLALQAVFGNKAQVRRWFETGAYTQSPHHFDIVLDFDEDFPAESFLVQMEKIKVLLRYAQKVSSHFQFYAQTALPEATVTVWATAILDCHMEQTTPLFPLGIVEPIHTQGAILWDF